MIVEEIQWRIESMPGIFGCFSSKPNHEKVFSLAKTMDYSIRQVKESEVSLVCGFDIKTSERNESIIQYEKNNFVIFSGEIFDENIKDPEKYMYHLYETGNIEKVKELNGSFLAAIYDDTNKKLTILNDRFGSIKLFYFYDKNQLFFSPKIAPLLKMLENKKIRKDAVIDFLIFGFFIGDKTFDENIFQLPPASILEITQNKMNVKSYWTYPCDGRYDIRDKEILIDELGKRWQSAVERQVKNKQRITIQISGGLDSRAILAAALKSTKKENILLYTFGEQGSYDFDIGTGIAKMLGLQQISFHPIKEHFAEQYNKSFGDSEGMIDATPYYPVQIDNALTQRTDTLYNGYMGGEIMGPLIFAKIKNLQLDSDASYEKAKNILLNHHRINDIDTVHGLLQKSYLGTMPILSSFEKSIEELRQVSTEEFPNYCARWLYLNESDKLTWFSNYRHRNLFHYYTPFLDNNVVDFMIKIPPELRTNKLLYKKMLLKNYPELFNLPTKNNLGLSLQVSPLRLNVKRVLWFIQRRINDVSNLILRRTVLFNKYENFINYDDLLRTNTEYKQYMRTMLDKVKTREFFNPEYIDTLFDLHLKGKKNYARLFGLLVTFELILENYYDSS